MSSLVLDEELRGIFKAECSEHLGALSAGFLALERQPDQPALLHEMFRAAHSLKGASRVSGLTSIEGLAHGLEEVMSGLRSGGQRLHPRQHDALSALIGGVGELVDAELAGTADPARAAALERALAGCLREAPSCSSEAPPPCSTPAPAGLATATAPPVIATAVPSATAPASPALVTAPVSRGLATAPAAPALTTGPADGEAALPRNAVAWSAGLDLLRVPAARLDELLTRVGELLALRQKLRRRAEEAGELGALLEVAAESEIAGARLERGPRASEATEHADRAERLARALREDEQRLGALFGELESAVRRTRLVPLSALFDQCPRWARDIARSAGKPVVIDVSGGEIELDKRVVDGLKDPLLHLLRNAIDHGIEPGDARIRAGKPEAGRIAVRAARSADGVVVHVEDDGGGIDDGAVRATAVARGRLTAARAGALTAEGALALLFEPGFTTRASVGELSGRGVGLDVVRTQLDALRGSVKVTTRAGAGTTFALELPRSIGTIRAVVVDVGELRVAIPAAAVLACLQIDPKARITLEGREAILHDGAAVPLRRASELLGVREPSAAGGGRTEDAIVLEDGETRVALIVTALVDELEVVQKPLGPRLLGLRALSGITVLGDSRPCFLVNVHELLHRSPPPAASRLEAAAVGVSRRHVLVADDSTITRIQLRRILESAGFDVSVAVDGIDAWSKLTSSAMHALVSDVEMPGMNGFELTARLRADARFSGLPVLLVTSLSSEADKRRGLEAGANAYITKGKFDQTELLETLERLV